VVDKNSGLVSSNRLVSEIIEAIERIHAVLVDILSMLLRLIGNGSGAQSAASLDRIPVSGIIEQ
jgi:hypothetical protein